MLFRGSFSVITLTILITGLSLGLGGCERLEEEPADDKIVHQPEKKHDHKHGLVEFPVWCSKTAQQEIETGLAHLHHMMYEQARPHFKAAAEDDKECAMAHWGIAMSSFQPLWHPTSEEGMKMGKAAVERAMEIGAPTEREQGYIEAVAAFFNDPEPAPDSRAADHEARIKAWMEAQRKLHEKFPEDVDAAAFYALSEVCYAMTQFSPAKERDYTREKRAGEILERYLELHPEHPGLFHYLIHAYDSPKLAPRAEEVARAYDKLAPDTVHALHMPSHIFVRLGYWEETVEWNKRSAETALGIMDEDPHASAHYVHALDYMMYGYLQMGDTENARKTLDNVRNVTKLYPARFAAYNTAAPQARFYLEQHKWEEAAGLQPGYPDVIEWEKFPESYAIFYYARGLGSAVTGDLEQAEADHAKIEEAAKELHDSGDAYWGYMTEALGKAVEARILYEKGETEKALELMKQAADLESSMDKHPITPGEILPVRELYAELLLEEGRVEEAEKAFKESLERTPNRKNALEGVERASRKATD